MSVTPQAGFYHQSKYLATVLDNFYYSYFPKNDVQDIEVVQKLFITGKQVGQYDDKDNLIAVYPSFKEAARAVNGTSSAISRICSGINVHHKGYKWKIVEEIVQDID